MNSFEKLKQNYEFRRAYNKGAVAVTPYFVLYTVKGRKGRVRMGITVSRKFGNAVKRNRAKRLITAAFSENLAFLNAGYDYVFVARTKILSVKSTAVSAALRGITEQAAFGL